MKQARASLHWAFFWLRCFVIQDVLEFFESIDFFESISDDSEYGILSAATNSIEEPDGFSKKICLRRVTHVPGDSFQRVYGRLGVWINESRIGAGPSSSRSLLRLSNDHRSQTIWMGRGVRDRYPRHVHGQ